MKTLLKLLALAAAALLCLPASLMAQNISVSTTSLTWSASDTSEQAIHVSAEYGVTWTVSVSSSAFIADTSEGEGSDFIHVAPAAQNTGSSPVTAVLTVSTGGSSAQVSLSQSAPEVNPTERIALPGNWTITRTYTNAAGTSSFEDITFYDGLGYAEQIVQVGASPSGGKNIVTPVWYDAMRRDDARSYLPYVSTNSSRTEESTSSVLTNQSTWYNNNGWSGQGYYAFSEQEYEASPLNRVLKARKPGSTYAKALSGTKAVQMTYAANAASEVRKLSVNSAGQLILSGGYYGAGTLHKVTTTDEDNAVSIVWTDVLGRTVLSRTLLDSDNDPNMDPDDVTYYDTYYVYDDDGHLCWVVTPEGSALLETSDTWPVPTSPNGTSTESTLAQAAARYCYIYTWDGLGRQLSRKIPGKAVEYFVYDRAGRLVMSQDGLQRTAGLWVTCKYDNAGRLIRRALLSSTQSRAYFQNLFESSNTPSAVYPSLGDTVLEVYDYGSYTNASSAGLSFSAVSGVVAATDVDQTRIKGLKTYEKVAILSGTGMPSTYVQRAFYYDALGRLKTTTSGSGANAVTTSDTFNIQGWLTSRTAMKGTGGSASNIFSMSLGYYTPVQSGATARYSGDISSWAWTQYGQTAKAYAFSYDGAHRLTAGQYYSGGSATNALSEKSITYDRAGNITAITRYNNAGAATTLNYSYAGNRLSSIGTASYAYDTDGNLTTDGRRELSLTYNLLGLPAGVTASVGGAAKASYTYLSDGSKAGVVNGSNGYWYLGSFVYNRSKVLESVAFGGGRILKNGSDFLADYHISDHLGSVRAVVRNGSVIEQNDYFTFGSRHDNGMASQSAPVANRFRYNGKELQTTGSLGYLDYGARFYDPDIARWNAVDPLAVKYLSFAPYAYCGGNPIRYSDYEGLGWWDKAIGFITGIVTNIIPGSSPLRDVYSPSDAADYNRALQVADKTSFALGGAAVIGGEFGIGAGTSIAIAGASAAGTIIATPEGIVMASGGAITITGSEVLHGFGIMLMANSAANKAGGYERGKSDDGRSLEVNSAKQGTPRDARRLVRKGKGPAEIERIDMPKSSVPNSQWHAHSKKGGALNQDGTIHDKKRGSPNFSKETQKWLQEYGWEPNE